jgi:phage terminase small subunit
MVKTGPKIQKAAAIKPDILNDRTIKKEIRKLKKMFETIEDPDKKALVVSLIEEAAFLKVALKQAKEELTAEGLTTTTTNASQKFVKAHPAAAIYKDYVKQYTITINQLIEYLPPKEKKTVSRLAALRGE